MEITVSQRTLLRRGALVLLGSAAVVGGALAADNAYDANKHLHQAVAAQETTVADREYARYETDTSQAFLFGVGSIASIAGFLVIEGVSRHNVTPRKTSAKPDWY